MEREKKVKERVVISSTCSCDKDPPILCLYFTHTAVPIMVVWTLGPPERVKEWEAERQLLCVYAGVSVCTCTAICCCAHYEAGRLLGHRHGQVSTPCLTSLSLSLAFAFSDSHSLRCHCFSTL